MASGVLNTKPPQVTLALGAVYPTATATKACSTHKRKTPGSHKTLIFKQILNWNLVILSIQHAKRFSFAFT